MSIGPATIYAWSKAFGIEDRTLARKLSRQKLPSSGEIEPRDIYLCLTGDAAAERARLLGAQADAAERENKTEDEKWFYQPDLEKFLTDHFILPIRQGLVAAPAELEMKTRAFIEDWRDKLLSALNAQLPKKK